MRVAILFLALASVCKTGPMCEGSSSRHGLRKYLTPEGRLQARLDFRDGQQGFAGISGEIWTIDPSGHFSIARFLNDKTEAPYLERTLTPAELRLLAKELAAKNLLDLPDSFGRDVKVDAHVLTLRFGTKQSSLTLRGGEVASDEATPPPNDTQASSWHNFIGVIKALQVLRVRPKRQ